MPDSSELVLLGGVLAIGFCAGFLCATWRAASDLVPRLRRPRP